MNEETLVITGELAPNTEVLEAAPWANEVPKASGYVQVADDVGYSEETPVLAE